MIWEMSNRACREILNVEVCVIRKSVSICFWNLGFAHSQTECTGKFKRKEHSHVVCGNVHLRER